ncbi:MAG: caspase family protein [Propylenella sp.]
MHRSPLRAAFTAAIAAFVLTAAPAEARRVALVIGNDAYESLPALEKAAADAKSYADLVRRKGFDQVIERTNLTRQEMDVAIAEFLDAIEPGDTALFAYSGHGWSDGGQNYLVGIDAPKSAAQGLLARISIPLQNGVTGIVDEMGNSGAALKVAIIDACRDNPFKSESTGRSVGLGRGLARVDPPRGTFVVFSAGTGQVALDRLASGDPDPNGVFTRTFLPLLDADMPLLDAVKAAQQKVFELVSLVSHEQEPAYYDQVRGSACLSESCGTAASAPVPVSDDPETKLWTAIANSTNAADFDAYLKAYPDGAYAPLAQSRIAALTPPAEPQPEPEPEPEPQPVDASLELLQQGQAADGRGDPGEAVRLYRLASEQGNARATALLGYAYEYGRGVKQDGNAAFELFASAAEEGDVQGRFSLAWAYNNGMGTSRDPVRSAELFLDVLRSGENADFYRKVIIDFASRLNRETIREFQRSLKATGLYSGAIDGEMGPGTRRALEAVPPG